MEPSLPPNLTFLPQPFEWVFIPGGQVTLKRIQVEGNYVPIHVTTVDPFYMAKYPITNAQYATYLQETGQPKHSCSLYTPEIGKELHPVQPLLWHEAMLFCKWVSEKIGYLIRLPSDAEWQRAAQGDDDRLYPWGNEWNNAYCNMCQSFQTTPVTDYPEGASPYGVMDMVGNVFEWCLTDPHTRSNSLEIPKDLSPETLRKLQRVFKGTGCCSSTRNGIGALVADYGSTIVVGPYDTGIRLVTQQVPLTD